MAVESAALKIQSTFRGKKIRSKLGGDAGAASGQDKQANSAANTKAAAAAAANSTTTAASKTQATSDSASSSAATETDCKQRKDDVADDGELSERVANMQVKDKDATDSTNKGAASAGELSGSEKPNVSSE